MLLSREIEIKKLTLKPIRVGFKGRRGRVSWLNIYFRQTALEKSLKLKERFQLYISSKKRMIVKFTIRRCDDLSFAP